MQLPVTQILNLINHIFQLKLFDNTIKVTESGVNRQSSMNSTIMQGLTLFAKKCNIKMLDIQDAQLAGWPNSQQVQHIETHQHFFMTVIKQYYTISM